MLALRIVMTLSMICLFLIIGRGLIVLNSILNDQARFCDSQLENWHLFQSIDTGYHEGNFTGGFKFDPLSRATGSDTRRIHYKITSQRSKCSHFNLLVTNVYQKGFSFWPSIGKTSKSTLECSCRPSDARIVSRFKTNRTFIEWFLHHQIHQWTEKCILRFWQPFR